VSLLPNHPLQQTRRKRRAAEGNRVTFSYQIQEIINGNAGLFKDMGERRSLDRLMSRNCQFQRLIHDMFLKANVASFRSDHDPSIPLKCSDDLIVGETRHFVHTASSINSAPGEKV
jgi:hypothetical protein